jgi:hypothetical protein
VRHLPRSPDAGGQDRQRTPRRAGGKEPDVIPPLPADRRAGSGHVLARRTGERTWSQVRQRLRGWSEEDYTPDSPGGSASETTLRHGCLPCAEVSLGAGDFPLEVTHLHLRPLQAVTSDGSRSPTLTSRSPCAKCGTLTSCRTSSTSMHVQLRLPH